MSFIIKRINFQEVTIGGNLDATDVDYNNSGSVLTSSNVQDAIDELANIDVTLQTAIDNHIADTTDAHDASAISNVPAGTISSTDAQSAINELDGDIQGHITDSTDAHAASAITNTPSGNLAATTVQAALNELQTDVDTRALDSALDQEIIDRAAADTVLQGNIDAEEARALAAEALLIPLAQKGANNGVATLDAGGKVPVAQLPSAVMTFEGLWDASTNSPTLADGVGDAGMVYRVSVAGTQDLGSGSIDYGIGDYVIYSGTIWQKSDGTDAVNSVFGRTGVVVATNGDYTASQVTNVPAGTIAAVTVQAAINELDVDVQDHIADTSGAHAASAIAVTPSGNLTSTDVQAALEELQTELDNFSPGSPGDIEETSFSLANNQASPADVTGLAFANGVVRSFQAIISVAIDATSDLFEEFELNGIQRGSDWILTIETAGDDSLIAFSITNAGQVQYTSDNYAGFSTGTIKFRAITTGV